MGLIRDSNEFLFILLSKVLTMTFCPVQADLRRYEQQQDQQALEERIEEEYEGGLEQWKLDQEDAKLEAQINALEDY